MAERVWALLCDIQFEQSRAWRHKGSTGAYDGSRKGGADFRAQTTHLAQEREALQHLRMDPIKSRLYVSCSSAFKAI